MTSIDNTSLEGLGLAAKPQAMKDSLGQDDFLKLMTAQLNNQDPMKPMENGDFLSQIEQLSAVTGIETLNTSFGQVATSMNSSQALQASALVGRSVLVPPNEEGVFLDETGSILGSIDMPAPTNNLRMGIFDSAGQLVQQIDMGAQSKGLIPFQWNGLNADGARLPAGQYQIQALADFGSDTEAVATLVAANVESVSLGGLGQEISLNLAGMGKIPMTSVRQIM